MAADYRKMVADLLAFYDLGDKTVALRRGRRGTAPSNTAGGPARSWPWTATP